MILIFTVFIVLFFLSLFVLVIPVNAQVILTEIYPNPTSTESEWVEIYNQSSDDIDLSGWFLEDQLSSPKNIYTFDLILGSHQYYLANISGQLNNGGDGVRLKDLNGSEIDKMSYSSSTQGMSWALQADGSFIESMPTPGEDNTSNNNPSPSPISSPITTISPLPTSSPSPLIISDLSGKIKLISVMSCPSNGREWFELQNISSEVINGDILLVDSQGNELSFIINLEEGQLQKYHLSRHILNNSGDEFNLSQNNSDTLFSYQIPKCGEKDIPFVLQNGNLSQTIDVEEETTNEDDIESNQGEVLGISLNGGVTLDDNVEKGSVGRFKYPNDYLSSLNLVAQAQVIEGTSSAVVSDTDEKKVSDEKDDNYFLSTMSIIFGGIILSTTGMVYFYRKDLFKDY